MCWERCPQCATTVGKDEEGQEYDHTYLHGLWRLVAGADQNGSWYSNLSTLLHVRRLTARLYGKVEGM